MRSRYDNQIGPTTIKRCRHHRRQYRKKNRTRAHIKNGNYKRKNTITRKKYKGGFLGRLKTWWASRKNPYKLVGNEAPVNGTAADAWTNVAEEVEREAQQSNLDSIATERRLIERERGKSGWKDRWNGFRANFTRKQPHQPPTTRTLSSHHVKEQFERELRAEQREAASAWKEAELTVPHKVAENFKPKPVLLSITNDDYTQMPPPYIFSNIDSITNRANYQSQPKSVDEWNAFKGAVLMPTWNSQVGDMKAHVEFMNQFNDSDPEGVDLKTSEAMIWKVVCDTEIVRNVLIHSISNFTCAESIGTCLAFQRFLFPFSTDIVSELYKKRFPIEFELHELHEQRRKHFENYEREHYLIQAIKITETIFKSYIGVIKNFAENLLESIMLQMFRDDYYCTYELNAKRELLLRLVICMVKMNNQQTTDEIIAGFYTKILILFEVDDNKSKHYDEYKEIMTEILKGYAYAANQEPYPYIDHLLQQCQAVAGKYSKRLKISRAAEITGLPVQTNPVQAQPLQPIIKRANVAECNSTTPIDGLSGLGSLCKHHTICHSLGSLSYAGHKYHVYPQDKLCDTVTGKLRDNATVFGVTKTEKTEQKV